MTAPVKLHTFKQSPLSLELLSSVRPSPHLEPAQDGVELCLTVYGEDPESSMGSAQMRASPLLRSIEGWLVEQGESLGVVSGGGGVEWRDADHTDPAGLQKSLGK